MGRQSPPADAAAVTGVAARVDNDPSARRQGGRVDPADRQRRRRLAAETIEHAQHSPFPAQARPPGLVAVDRKHGDAMSGGGPGQGGLRIADGAHVRRRAEPQPRTVERPRRLDRRPDLHLDPTLAGQSPADDLTPEGFDRLAVVRAGAVKHPRQHRLFAVGTQLHMGAGGRVLGLADAGGDGEAAFEQGQKLVIELIDLMAQGGEGHVFGRDVDRGGPDLLKGGRRTGMGHGKGLSNSVTAKGVCEPPPRPGAVAGEVVRTKSPTPQPAYRKP